MHSMICRLICLFFLSLFGCNQCGSDDGNPYSLDIGEVSEGGTVTNLPSYISYDDYDESVLLEVSCEEGMTTEGGYLSVRCLNSDETGPTRFICVEGIVNVGDAGSENNYNTDCMLFTCEEEPVIGNCSTFFLDIEEVNEEGTATNLPSYISSDEGESPLLEVSCAKGVTTENGHLRSECHKGGGIIGVERFTCEEGIVKFDDGDSYDTTCVLYHCDEESSLGYCDTFEGGPL